jgi:hypothetical protein
LEDFVIHDETSANQRTDADLLGVRFAFRRENYLKPMIDHPPVANCKSFVNVVIAEVKSSGCELNGPWTDRGKQNVQRVLRAIGCFPDNEIEKVAAAVYRTGRYESHDVTCRLLAFGDREGKLAIRNVPQILFNEMLIFIHARIREYRDQKKSVGNWSSDGQEIHRLADTISNVEEFVAQARTFFGLRVDEHGT